MQDNTMRFDNIFLKLLFFTLFFSCFYGCQTEGEEHATNQAITIRLAHWWGDAKSTWDSVITEFKKSHPKIHIQQEVMSFNVMKDKVLTQSAAGQHVSDILPLEDWFAQELVEREYFTDIAALIANDLDASQYFPIALNTFRKGDQIQAWPIALLTYPLVYNTEIFDDAGIPYPDSTWTFDTLLTVAKQLTKDFNDDGRVDQYGILLDNSGGFDGTIWSLGGAILTEDGQRSAFAQPNTIEALQFWVGLVREHQVAPQNASILGGTSSGGSLRPFETGRFAMAIISPHTISPNTAFRWDIALPPQGKAGRKYLRGAAAFGIPKTSKHPQEAWEFIRWIVEEMPAQYASRIFPGSLPNSTRLAEAPEYLNASPHYNRQVLQEMITKHSFSYWRTRWLEFRDHGFLPELDLMISGEKSVLNGAYSAEKKINAVLQ